MKTAEEDSDYLVDHSIVMYVSVFLFGHLNFPPIVWFICYQLPSIISSYYLIYDGGMFLMLCF